MLARSGIVKVAICSPQPIIREGLRRILGQEKPFHILLAPILLERTVAWVQDFAPDVVLYDATSTEKDLALLAAMKRCKTGTKTIMLLEHLEENFVIRAVEQGAFGCLLKTASRGELIKALHAVQAGELWLSRALIAKMLNYRRSKPPSLSSNPGQLTPRQQQIGELVSCGMSNRDIAAKLLISEATVRAHMNDIFKKMGLHRRVQLAIRFTQNNRVPIEVRRAKQSTRNSPTNVGR